MGKSGKVVLVTGANKGLGKEIASQLGALGHTIVLAARNEAAGMAATNELTQLGYDVHSVQLEVTNPDHIASVAAFIEAKFGKLDILVNNAGIALEWDGSPTTADKIRRTLEVNVVAVYALTEAMIPLLAKSDDARVINQSSMLGSLGMAEGMWDQIGNFMTVGYSASKAALNMITLILSKQLADRSIAVTAAHPGWVKTDLGGQAAPMEVTDGAKSVVQLATIARDQFPNGQLIHMGERLPW